MTFDQWKRKLLSLAKQAKLGYIVPGNDTLYVKYESGITPEQSKFSCTKENWRFNVNDLDC